MWQERKRKKISSSMFILSFSSSKICQYAIYNDKKRCVRTTTPPHSFNFLLFMGGRNWGNLNQKFLETSTPQLTLGHALN